MSTLTIRMLGLSAAALLGLAACQSGDDSSTAARARPAAPVCERDCLLGVFEVYLTALLAHDPQRAPFAVDAKFTENAQVLELGDGLWNTASAPPQGYKLVVADATTGQAGFYLIMQESGKPVWLAGRLKVEDLRITELETVVIRQGGFGNFERAAPANVWNEIIEPSLRRPREQMIEIADSYFTAIADNLVDSVPFDDACARLENGVQTANNPVPPPPPPPGGVAGPNTMALSCRENINSPIWAYITQIEPRRYFVVDEERGIVFGIFMFHQDGSVASVDIPGFGEYQFTGAARQPFTTVIPEMFKIVDGKIRQIEAIMASLPYGSKSRWDD